MNILKEPMEEDKQQMAFVKWHDYLYLFYVIDQRLQREVDEMTINNKKKEENKEHDPKRKELQKVMDSINEQMTKLADIMKDKDMDTPSKSIKQPQKSMDLEYESKERSQSLSI